LLFTEENHQEVITSVGFEDLDRDEMLQIVRVGKEKKRNSSIVDKKNRAPKIRK
jgi:hypothetical protein